jgi:hypothetical protein
MELRKHARALRFVKKVLRGFVARVQFRQLVVTAERCRAAVASLLSACEASHRAEG